MKVLPGVAPFTCPECDKDASRDRITLTRHYAFAHNKLFEMTDVTPEMLNPSNTTNHSLELKKFVRMEDDEEDVANQNNQVEDRVKIKQKVEKKEDLKLERKEDIESEAKVDVKLEKNEDFKLEKKEDLNLEKKEHLKLEKGEDVKLEKEHLKLKEDLS